MVAVFIWSWSFHTDWSDDSLSSTRSLRETTEEPNGESGHSFVVRNGNSESWYLALDLICLLSLLSLQQKHFAEKLKHPRRVGNSRETPHAMSC
jgi:hypothetical protein